MADNDETGKSQQIIPLSQEKIGDETVETVDARELHGFLEIGKDFSNWIKDRILKYGFVENVDFVCSPVLASDGRGGSNRLDYHLSLDMAKEVSMVERNEKGKQARQYFIECEKIAKQPPQLNDPVFLRSTLLDYTEKVLELQQQVEDQAPLVEGMHRIAMSDGSLCITDAAKTLQIRPKDLFQYLRSNGWVYRRTGNSHDCAYQSKIVSGLLEHKTTVVSRSDGSEKITEQVRVTPKGLAKLAEILPPLAQAA